MRNIIMSNKIKREIYLDEIATLFLSHPIVALLGPRQSGKTTLAKQYSKAFNGQVHYFDLEDPASVEALINAKTTLYDLEGLIVIDEVQRSPNLFPVLRFIIDERREFQKYLILGSASRDLVKQSSETLAGRIAYQEVAPFSLQEVPDHKKLFLRGGFPNAYLAESDKTAFLWLENYIRTFLERDIPSLGITIPPIALRRFWMMLSHYHGNIFNASEISRSLGISDKTVKNYLDILTGTFMVRQLLPWHENISKRQVKSPKIYIRNSGILHCLFDINSYDRLLMNPKIGASWEGFALEQVISHFDATNFYFWGVNAEYELDLLIFHEGKKIGFEFKYSDAPKMTKSINGSLELLNLDELNIIYPGDKQYSLSDKVTVIPLKNICHPNRD